MIHDGHLTTNSGNLKRSIFISRKPYSHTEYSSPNTQKADLFIQKHQLEINKVSI